MKSTKNKTQRPKEIHNHPRNIDTIKSHTLIEMKVFNDLSVAREDVEETFWLLSFYASYESLFFLGRV